MAEKANEAAYDSDFFAWTQQQAAALAAGDAAALDWVNLAEELETCWQHLTKMLGCWRKTKPACL